MKSSNRIFQPVGKDVFALEQMLNTIPESRNALSAALGDKDYNSLRQVSRTTRTALTEVSVLRDRLRSHLSCPARSRCANALAPTKQAPQKAKPPPLRFDAEMARHRGADGKVNRDSLLAMLAALRQLGTVPYRSKRDRALSKPHLQTALNTLHSVCPSLALDGAIIVHKSSLSYGTAQSAWELQCFEYAIMRLEQANTWSTFCSSLRNGLSGHILVALAIGPLPSVVSSPSPVHLGTFLLLGAGKLRSWRDIEPYLEKLVEPCARNHAIIEFGIGAFIALVFSFTFWTLIGFNFDNISLDDMAVLADQSHASILMLTILWRLYKPLFNPLLNCEEQRHLNFCREFHHHQQALEQFGQIGPHQVLESRLEILKQTDSSFRHHEAELLAAAQVSGDYEPFLAFIFRTR